LFGCDLKTQVAIWTYGSLLEKELLFGDIMRAFSESERYLFIVRTDVPDLIKLLPVPSIIRIQDRK
jgi:hypothetical protein